MRGLLLNHYYSTDKSIRNGLLLTVFISLVLHLAQQSMALRAAAFVPFLLMVQPAFEVLKHDAMSGWNKFVFTLPLRRSQLVQSHYIWLLLLLATGTLIAYGLFFGTAFFVDSPSADIFYNFSLRAIGIVICMGALSYPLTFWWGTEKSDQITLMSVGFGLGMFFLVSMGLLLFLGADAPSYDRIFSISLVAVSLLVYLISYVISVRIYNTKEG